MLLEVKLLDVERLSVIKYTEFNNWIIKHVKQVNVVMCIEGVKNPEFACKIADVGWTTGVKEWGLRIVLVCLLLAQCSGAIGKKSE